MTHQHQYTQRQLYVQQAQSRSFQPSHQHQGQQGRKRKKVIERRVDPIPVSYAQLLPQLLANQLVQLRELRPTQNPLPRGYDVSARCEFHSEAPGHTIENYRALKTNA